MGQAQQFPVVGDVEQSHLRIGRYRLAGAVWRARNRRFCGEETLLARFSRMRETLKKYHLRAGAGAFLCLRGQRQPGGWTSFTPATCATVY